MAQFIKIKDTRINVDNVNYYTVSIRNGEYKLLIDFDGYIDDIEFVTKDKHEFESWLEALGEEQ